LWAQLWRLPIGEYWHAMRISPSVVERYVTLAQERPESPSVSKLETELGLTPAALLRMRLVVEPPEPEYEPGPDPYAHLKAAGYGE
jgi:hypothetical protein